MNFLTKNKKAVNAIYIVSVVLDIGIGFLINKVSQDGFELFAGHNIVISVILVLLTLAYIACQVVMRAGTAKIQRRRLQKAFQDNGGYETVVDEMKHCIERHDYKSIKELKKIVDYIER